MSYKRGVAEAALGLGAIVLVAGLLWACVGVAYAGHGWPRTPTDEEIRLAAEHHVSECNYPVTRIYEYQTFKLHLLPSGPDEVLICVRKDGGMGDVLAVFYYLDYGCYYDCKDTCEWRFGFGGFSPAFAAHWESLGSCAADIDHLFELCPEYARGWLGEPPPTENHPPTVSLTYSPQNPTPADTVHFSADASDPDGDPLTYKWYVNGVEQANATRPNVQWANPPAGTYTVTVVVSDGKGGTAQDSVEFTVQAAQPRYVIMPGTGDLEGEEPIAFVGKIWMDGELVSEPKTPLYRAAFVKTGPGVEIKVVFRAGAFTLVEENSYFEVREEKFAKPDWGVIYTRLIEGIGHFYIPKGAAAERKFEVETNMVVVGIKGTEVTIEHTSGVTTVTVTEGEVEVTDKTTGLVSIVRVGETARFDGTTPPSGGKTIAQALDANGSGVLEDSEILTAIQYWISGEPVPGTGGKTISDAEMLRLIQLWISGESVRSASATATVAQPPALEPLMVEGFTLSPNPIVNGRGALLEVRGSGIAGIELEVFNLAGRRVFQQQTIGSCLAFQGLDNAGRTLANGVYLYIVTARGYDGRAQRSEVRKLVVLR